MDENNAISVVENLIETCKDGQKGYQDAAQHVKRSDLKTYFNEKSLERSRFAGELEAELVRSEEHTSELQSLRHLVCRLLLGTLRSEEHTSELQSLRHLVCRLLLEIRRP